MLSDRTDRDELGAVTDAVNHRARRVELLAQLIEIGHFEPCAMAHGSSVGCQFAEEQTQ